MVRKSNRARRSNVILIAFLLSSVSITGCGNTEAESQEKNFNLADYLCLITPVSCHSDFYKQVYLAPPEATYEITLNGKRLVVPMGYLRTSQLLTDPRYPVKQSLYLEMLLPDLTPHSPHNIREFFTPYERSNLRIEINVRSPGSSSVNESIISWITLTKRESNTLMLRKQKYGLEGWGEDFDQWPRRRPCANMGRDEPPCGTPSTPSDVWYPITPNGTPSVMICDPDILEDRDAIILAMPTAEREAYFADPKQWAGRGRAMCSHYMLYEPVDSFVTLIYPRRFIAQWKQTEDGVRRLLDTFIARGANQ